VPEPGDDGRVLPGSPKNRGSTARHSQHRIMATLEQSGPPGRHRDQGDSAMTAVRATGLAGECRGHSDRQGVSERPGGRPTPADVVRIARGSADLRPLEDWERAAEGFWRIAPKTELDRVAAAQSAGSRSG
jgi:hypothetical protein